jgi:hypothetical protein
MSITLAVGSTTLTLSDDLTWNDENKWAPVEQTAQRSVTGALIVSTTARQAGRPITLQSGDDAGWISYSAISQLRNWAASPGLVMVLTLRGAPRNVIFRHHDGNALEADPVVQYRDVQSSDWYRMTLRLMEI